MADIGDPEGDPELVEVAEPDVTESPDVAGLEQSLLSTNGLRSINGLTTANGLTAVNGLRTINGLRSINGLSEATGLMTTAAGRDTVSYLVRCALSASQSITKKDNTGKSYTFKGQIGAAPAWADGACNLDCQESVSACMLAHINTSGKNINLWLVGNMPNVGWGQSTGHPYQEGSFFGNIFVDNPMALYCHGRDFDTGVVPGRIGATQTSAPYTNPYLYAGGTGVCANYCTPTDIPNQNDGYKACSGFNHVMTVWRNFDPTVNYKICNKASGKCLDAAGNTAEGSAVVQKGYTGANSQKWNVVQVNSKQYKLINVSSKKALELYQGKTADGTSIVQSSYSGATKQLWSLTSTRDATGLHRFQPVLDASGALNVPSSTLSQEGGKLEERTWSASSSGMKWSVVVTN